jgi:L-lactate utilization protein LutC
MQVRPSDLIEKILGVLTQDRNRTYTLEELTKIVCPVYTEHYSLKENISAQREMEATVLDALIMLEDEGFIILNSDTDESSNKC